MNPGTRLRNKETGIIWIFKNLVFLSGVMLIAKESDQSQTLQIFPPSNISNYEVIE